MGVSEVLELLDGVVDSRLRMALLELLRYKAREDSEGAIRAYIGYCLESDYVSVRCFRVLGLSSVVVGRVLSRLASAGVLERCGRGVYRLMSTVQDECHLASVEDSAGVQDECHLASVEDSAGVQDECHLASVEDSAGVQDECHLASVEDSGDVRACSHELLRVLSVQSYSYMYGVFRSVYARLIAEWGAKPLCGVCRRALDAMHRANDMKAVLELQEWAKSMLERLRELKREGTLRDNEIVECSDVVYTEREECWLRGALLYLDAHKVASLYQIAQYLLRQKVCSLKEVSEVVEFLRGLPERDPALGLVRRGVLLSRRSSGAE